MGIGVVVIGRSGTGKSTGIRNLDPEKTLLIQVIRKALPFRSAAWKPWDKASKTGSIAVTDKSSNIVAAISRAKDNGKSIIVIDDFQYLMANEFMSRSAERGYDKFTDIARHAWDVMNAVLSVDDDVRVYILTHSDTDEYGQNAKMKTIGKMLDEKIVLEGMVTIVLKSTRSDDGYFFATQNDGTDTVKSPLGMFESDLIVNDIAEIDATICEYYGIENKKQEQAE